METTIATRGPSIAVLAGLVAGLLPWAAGARILGETSSTGTFHFTAKADVISTSDGDSMWMWGYAVDGRRMQYPGPTLIVNQGDTVTVTLQNQLPVPVSIVFPGMAVTATGGAQGLLTREVPAAAPGATTGSVTYVFRAEQPGTYSYTSGTRRDLEVEMGLFGAIVVRPRDGGTVVSNRAYPHASTAFEQEYLFVVSEADPLIHQQVAFGLLAQIDMTKRHPVDWFINGRNFPDTLQEANAASLPTQPYNCAPVMHPADRVLIRWVDAGADLHPFHTHGQNHVIIARDGRLVASPGSASPDLGVSDYTTTNVPGETVDAIWGPWTGAKLAWDVYGTQDVNPHTCDPAPNGFDPISHEYCADHNKPIPVTLPSQSELTYGVGGGGMWGGTPYLGVPGDVPPVNPGAQNQLNLVGGIAFMWHSHAERELTTNNIFIGGMASMALVVPVSVPIP